MVAQQKKQLKIVMRKSFSGFEFNFTEICSLGSKWNVMD